MKDNWNELFDSMKDKDILRNLPEELPEMEDELAAKRIENRVMQVMQSEMGMQKKQNRKRFVAAAACGILAVGLLGHKPIMAAFERLFHDLPGVGVYINDTDTKVYEVQIDAPSMEKDGVKIELKNFYCANNQIFGDVIVTGMDLMTWGEDIALEENDNNLDILEKKFFPTWYYGDTERKMITGSLSGTGDDDERYVKFCMRCEEYLRLEQGVDTYQIQIAGFDERFTLKIVEPKSANTPEEIGYTVTKNDTSVIARAFIRENDKIEVEHFVIPSDEVKKAEEKWRRLQITVISHNFDHENYFYIENVDGERMKGKYEALGNGGKHLLQGTEEDFPLKLHYSPFTGTNDEEYTKKLPLPGKGKMITKGLPKVNFEYGTVEVLSVTQKDSKESAITEITVTYQTIPNDGERKMYAVQADLPEAMECYRTSENSEQQGKCYLQTVDFKIPKLEEKYFEIIWHTPSYWIEGDYDIIIEKPMEE